MSQITDTYDLANNRYLNTNYHLTINTYHTYSESYCAPAVNLPHLRTLYVHPVTRLIFRNIVGINWQ